MHLIPLHLQIKFILFLLDGLSMVGRDGFEPPRFLQNGFTARRNQPLCHRPINALFGRANTDFVRSGVLPLALT